MTNLSIRTLTRWLTPWRTIRRLQTENQQLREQAVLRAAYRLRNCPTHGPQSTNAWGCSECVRELRGELATAREALQRLVRYSPYDGEVVRGVYLWATDNGMTGPLPPLPDRIAKRDHIAKRDQLITEDQP